MRARGLHRGQRLLGDKGGIGIKHDHVATEIGQEGGCLQHGVPGAQLFGLAHAIGPRGKVSDGFLNRVRTMAGDHDDPGR